MRTEVIYSSSNDTQEALHQIKEKLRESNINPSFLFLFLTAGTWKAYEDFNELLESYYPHAKMLGCIVEGYIAEDEIWTRGVSILLAEFDGEVEVFWANEDSATETVEKLGDKIGEGWDSILLMFPAFYFPGKLDFLRFFFNDKNYYRSFIKNKDNIKGVEALEAYSKYLDEKKMAYPIDRTLKTISEKTGKRTPILGMNLMPLEASSNTPLILANYENIENGIATMCFKGKLNTLFHDVFPERGESYKSTFNAVEEYFPNTEEVRVTKKNVAIGKIDGLKPVEFLKKMKSGFEDLEQDDFLKKVENGQLEMATPYGVAFISKVTFGASLLGLFSYPLSIYPSLFELDNFYDDAAFCAEYYKGGIRVFGGVFEKKELTGFDFFVIDQNAIMSFGGEVFKLKEVITKKSKSFFGVFSSFPSAYIVNSSERKYLSEIEDRLFVNLSGTSALIEFE